MATTVLTPVVDVLPEPEKDSPLSRIWAWSWPKLLAIGLVLGAWQIVVWSGWRPEYVLPGPIPTLQAVWEMMGTDRFWSAIATTLTRAVAGFALALLIGTTIGVLVARVRPLRLAVGALITGLQTMPSISWFPLAILLFGINEQAILFVVVLGAAPSIANGVISGIDQVPPAFWRLGRVLGAGPFAMYRNIILPAALPGYVSGLTQGWAFAWRSLMAGELLVIIAERPSLGAQLEFARQLAKAPQLLGTMLVILVIGMLVDGLFSSASRRMRERRGLAT
ncbi:MAG: ABC transporter permease [Candidatus Nanopelagicales bacterium]|jgi:NitT/TauT family transport system permease protein|nr:ABC transporter permease [Actinomycetota bacterium]HRY11510.1 ABC transporter permease [Candidatus Nanopelagicales bacterium]HUM86442.1 ABC transporter permease [Actinomycetota bacterium]